MNSWAETTSAFLPNASSTTHSEAWYGESDFLPGNLAHENPTVYYHAPPTRPNDEHPIQSALGSSPPHMMMEGYEFGRNREMAEHLTPGTTIDNVQDDPMQSHGRQLPRFPSTGRSSLTCPNRQCAGTFVRWGELRRHLRCTCKFNDKSKTRVVCNKCGKSYSRRDAMLRHFAEWHG